MRRYVVTAVGALMLGACGGSGSGDDQSQSDGVTAVEFALTSGPDFKGNSVYICADRSRPSDSKYPCDNHSCQCFNFDTDGRLMNCDKGPARFENLCPTADYPVANWKFEYTVYGGPDCKGTPITSPRDPWTYNFTCHDAADLNERRFPNSWVEPLVKGENRNDIVCITTNASKAFDFDVCVDITPTESVIPSDNFAPPGGNHGLLVLDCGCRPARPDVLFETDIAIQTADEFSKVCVCKQGIDYETLPRGCHFSYRGCNIVCDSTPPPK